MAPALRGRRGRRVDRGGPFHPEGHDEIVAVALAPRLEGSFVARFRVISEDGHPVAKSLTFRVRPRPRDENQAAPPVQPSGTTAPPAAAVPEDEMAHLDTGAGKVTDVAFAAARGLGYLAIAFAIGGALFLFVARLPGLAQVAGCWCSDRWRFRDCDTSPPAAGSRAEPGRSFGSRSRWRWVLHSSSLP